MSTIVYHTPNSGPAVQEVWAFVSRDAAGQENVISAKFPVLGITPMMTGNPKTFERYKSIVRDSRAELEAAGQTIHLYHFTNREEIERW